MGAADILLDHFGDVAKRVGIVLLERGQLTLQTLLRFVNQAAEVGDEPLRFVRVRNAVLTLLQHGLVVAKRSPAVAEGDSTRAVPQIYSMNVDEVLSRLRFSHFLEYTLWQQGEV